MSGFPLSDRLPVLACVRTCRCTSQLALWVNSGSRDVTKHIGRSCASRWRTPLRRLRP